MHHNSKETPWRRRSRCRRGHPRHASRRHRSRHPFRRTGFMPLAVAGHGGL